MQLFFCILPVKFHTSTAPSSRKNHRTRRTIRRPVTSSSARLEAMSWGRYSSARARRADAGPRAVLRSTTVTPYSVSNQQSTTP